MKALYQGTVIAESEHTVVVEGNHYFPSDGVYHEFLVESDHTSTCPWKGEAKYYHVRVGGQESKNAAWYYPAPKEKARQITGHVAFWKDVVVED